MKNQVVSPYIAKAIKKIIERDTEHVWVELQDTKINRRSILLFRRSSVEMKTENYKIVNVWSAYSIKELFEIFPQIIVRKKTFYFLKFEQDNICYRDKHKKHLVTSPLTKNIPDSMGVFLLELFKKRYLTKFKIETNEYLQAKIIVNRYERKIVRELPNADWK